MTETFAIRFKARRLATVIPESPKKPEHKMTQAECADALKISLSAVRFYERGKRLPHPIVRGAIITLWPDFYG